MDRAVPPPEHTGSDPALPTLFADMVTQSRLAMVASDLRLPDRPLVFVNDAFVHMTGYRREDSIGRNCRFLQGEETDPETVRAIRDTIARGESEYFEIVNYRADGSRFWNGLHIGPVTDAAGERALYFGAQSDVTSQVEARANEQLRTRELVHRMGNLLAIVNVMVRTAAKGGGEDALRAALEDRLQALSRSNELVTPRIREEVAHGVTAYRRQVALHDVLRTVLTPIAPDGRITLEGPAIDLLQSDITNVALVVHELATNALKHGALSNSAGHIAIDWRVEGDRTHIDWHERDGPPVGPPGRKGMGTRLLDTVARGSHRPDAGLEHHVEGVRYRFDAGA